MPTVGSPEPAPWGERDLAGRALVRRHRSAARTAVPDDRRAVPCTIQQRSHRLWRLLLQPRPQLLSAAGVGIPLGRGPFVPGLALRGRRRAGARLTIAENSTPVSASTSSISNHRHQDGALAPANIAFEMENLLPGAENQLPIRDRHGQGWSEQCCLQVGMTIAIVPGLFVAVVAAGRNQLIQNGRHVSLQPGLELNRTDRRCAADVEDIGNSSFDTRGVHDGGHLLGDVFHVPVTFGIQRNLVLKAHVCLPYWYRGIFIRTELVASWSLPVRESCSGRPLQGESAVENQAPLVLAASGRCPSTLRRTMAENVVYGYA